MRKLRDCSIKFIKLFIGVKMTSKALLVLIVLVCIPCTYFERLRSRDDLNGRKMLARPVLRK